MIDIHSHILNDVDDGSDSLSNSIEILKKAEHAGFSDIILTPHFIEGYYDNTKSSIKEKINILKNELYNENVIVELHSGNEVFLSENTPNLIRDSEIATLANSRYVLFEVPFTNKMWNLENIVQEIKNLGCIPIMAHPERYAFFQEDPNSILRLLKEGVLLQCNYGSFIGQYGKEAKRLAEILLENKLIHFLGTDTHKHGMTYEKIDTIIKRIDEIAKNHNYVMELTTYNAKNILNDTDLYLEDYPEEIEEKKKSFSLFKRK